jgi:hypothetical protein
MRVTTGPDASEPTLVGAKAFLLDGSPPDAGVLEEGVVCCVGHSEGDDLWAMQSADGTTEIPGVVLREVGPQGTNFIVDLTWTGGTGNADDPYEYTVQVGSATLGTNYVPTYIPTLSPRPPADTGRARFLPDTGELHLIEAFEQSSPLFAVTLTQISGVAGSNSTACTFTYDVKDVTGATLGTGVSPAMARPSAGKFTAATRGSAYWDSGNAIVLWWCDEVPTFTVCS